jgi:hypothetical protein
MEAGDILFVIHGCCVDGDTNRITTIDFQGKTLYSILILFFLDSNMILFVICCRTYYIIIEVFFSFFIMCCLIERIYIANKGSDMVIGWKEVGVDINAKARFAITANLSA